MSYTWNIPCRRTHAARYAQAGRLRSGTQACQDADDQNGHRSAYRKANTSRRNQAHRIYPYLLRNLIIDRPNQVWAMDTTYIPMQRGFVYLTAVLDWATRRVLAWRLSNTLTADPCVEALEEAIMKYGPPDTMNTDQGSQFTSSAFKSVFKY